MASRKRAQAQEQADIKAAENGAVIEDEVVENTDQVTAPEGETVEQAPEAEQGDGVHCRLCNRPLTAEVSVTRGLGPVCAGHVARALGVDVKTLSLTDPTAEGYIAEDAVEASVEQVKAQSNSIPVEEFDPTAEANVHPKFPERGEMAFVKLADVHVALAAQGRSITKFVQAFGGNRIANEPKDWYWTPVYAGRVRYLPAEVMSHLDDIPLVRVRAPKAEASPEGEAEAPAPENGTVEVPAAA